MKALSLASFVLALGAVLIAVFASGSPGTEERGAARAATVPGASASDSQLAALREIMESIQSRLDELEFRQQALEARQAAAAPRALVALEESPEEESTTLSKLAAALENPSQAETTPLDSLVISVIDAKDERERAERDERRRTAVEDRMNERMLELTDELGLTPGQSEDMRRVLTHEQLTREELFTSMREDGVFDRREIRNGMQEIREQSRTELQNILAPDQLERYEELDGGGGFGGFGGGGRGGGGGQQGGGDRDRGRTPN